MLITSLFRTSAGTVAAAKATVAAVAKRASSSVSGCWPSDIGQNELG